MVKFDNTNHNFSFEVTGSQSEYIETIKALLFFMGHCQTGYDTTNETYYICNLIDGMLPDGRQIINLDEAEYLKTIKEQNNTTASTIVNKSNA